MASSSQPPASGSPVFAPPGWQWKLVPRKGKGQTPKKSDVIYVAPGGEEIKSKTHLQRYLKGHPGGPTASEFNWSSGETPTRRSERLFTKVPPENLETEVTPKRTKRNAAQVYEEERDEDKKSPSPRKRAAKDGKGTPLEGKDGDGTHAAASFIGKEEMIQDVEQHESKQSIDEVAGQTVSRGVEVDEGLEEKAMEEQDLGENAEDKFVIGDNERVFEQEVPSGDKVEDKTELMHGTISAISQEIEGLDGNTCNIVQPVSVEAVRGENFESLPVKSTGTESEVAPEMQEAIEQEQEVVDRIPEDGLPRKEEQGVEGNNPGCIGSSNFMEVAQGQEKGASRDAFCSPESVGVTN